MELLLFIAIAILLIVALVDALDLLEPWNDG
jgi:hypothetical protein